MPEICRFYGMVITMYFDDHDPPHFHVRYGGDKAVMEIGSLRVLEGRLPPRALGLVVEWAAQHGDELATNWQAARQNQPLHKIAPLV
jgi:hypothetical protein